MPARPRVGSPAQSRVTPEKNGAGSDQPADAAARALKKHHYDLSPDDRLGVLKEQKRQIEAGRFGAESSLRQLHAQLIALTDPGRSPELPQPTKQEIAGVRNEIRQFELKVEGADIALAEIRESLGAMA